MLSAWVPCRLSATFPHIQEEQMMRRNSDKAPMDRRGFIGGSCGRGIMSPDAAALIRLWGEKRGEAEPEGLCENLVVQLGVATEALNRTWYERNAGRVVTDVQRWVQHPVRRYMAATPRRVRQRPRRGVRGQVHATLVVLRRGRRRKAHGPASAQHEGDQRPVGGALDHHRRRQMDRNDHTRRRALPAFSGNGGAALLALRSDRRDPAPLWRRAAAAAGRSGSFGRYERLEFLGRVRRPLLRHPFRLSRPRASQSGTEGPDAGGRQGSLRPWRSGQAVEVGRGQL